MTTVSTPEDLGKAIKNNEDSIEISSDIKTDILRMVAIPKVPWAIAIGAVSATVLSVLTTGNTGPVSSPVTFRGTAFSLAPTVAASLLGKGAALAAISIAIAGGGVDALSDLRERYELLEHPSKTMLIKKEYFTIREPQKYNSFWRAVADIRAKCEQLFF